jgi:hypothetical protein
MADITTVVNNWNAAYANTAAVVAGTQFTGSYGTVSGSGTQGAIACQAAFATGLLTGSIYSWTGKGFYFQTTAAPKGGAATTMQTQYAIAKGASTNLSIRIMFQIDTAPATPTITCNLFNTDNTFTDTGVPVIENVGASHAWLGFYFSGSSIFWAKSANGITWSVMRQDALPSWANSSADLAFAIQPNRVAGTDTNALVDNVNVNGVPPGSGASFLQNVPSFKTGYPDAKLFVEWSPAAPVPTYGDDSTGWTWVDISGDVLMSNDSAISISPIGRSDASATVQPAGMYLTLDNTTGKYSKGPQNTTNYPNVKLNVPIKVSIALDGVSKIIRFQGYIWSMRPVWDETGRYAVVQVSASGMTRRLQQKSNPLLSPLKRAALRNTKTVQYWSMEDLKNAQQFSNNSSNNQNPLNFSNMNVASDTTMPGSAALPVMTATSTYQANITGVFDQSDSGSTTIFYFNVPTAPAADTAFMRIHMKASTTITRWELVIPSGGGTSVFVKGYLADGTLSVNDARGPFSYVGLGPLQWIFALHQNGANTEYTLVRGGILFSGSTIGTNTVAGTVGVPTQVSMLANAQNVGYVIGHIQILNGYFTNTTPLPAQAWVSDGGDSSVGRINRLCKEENLPLYFNGIPLTTGFDPTPWNVGDYTWVDYQTQLPILQLLQQAADANIGIFYDGIGPGVTFRERRSNLENQASKLSINAGTGQLSPPFQPEDDDQQVVNRFTASRALGGSATYQDDTGPLGTTSINIYDDSAVASVRYDQQLTDYAAWKVHLGTVEGYRYPTVTLDVRRVQSLAFTLLTILPGDMITITNISGWISGHPAGDIPLMVQGWSETLSGNQWSMTLNCSSSSVWRVGLLTTDTNTADTIDAIHLDSEASSVNTAALAAATSLSVKTTSSQPLWTTTAANFPFDLNVGGWRVTCTAISGAASPQTFTISALPGAVAVNATVKLWYPPTLGI